MKETYYDLNSAKERIDKLLADHNILILRHRNPEIDNFGFVNEDDNSIIIESLEPDKLYELKGFEY